MNVNSVYKMPHKGGLQKRLFSTCFRGYLCSRLPQADNIEKPSSSSHQTTTTASMVSSLPLDSEQDLPSATAESSRKVSAATSGSGSSMPFPLDFSRKSSMATSKRDSTCDSELSAGKVQLSNLTLRGRRKSSGLDAETLAALEEIEHNLKDPEDDATMKRALIKGK